MPDNDKQRPSDLGRRAPPPRRKRSEADADEAEDQADAAPRRLNLGLTRLEGRDSFKYEDVADK